MFMEQFIVCVMQGIASMMDPVLLSLLHQGSYSLLANVIMALLVSGMQMTQPLYLKLGCSRCELKHVNGSISLGSIIITIGAIIIVILVFALVFLYRKFQILETMLRAKTDQDSKLSQKLISQNGSKSTNNPTFHTGKSTMDRLELTRCVKIFKKGNNKLHNILQDSSSKPK